MTITIATRFSKERGIRMCANLEGLSASHYDKVTGQRMRLIYKLQHVLNVIPGVRRCATRSAYNRRKPPISSKTQISIHSTLESGSSAWRDITSIMELLIPIPNNTKANETRYQ